MRKACPLVSACAVRQSAAKSHWIRHSAGARTIVGRSPRKRGGKASKPGHSDEQQAVLIARDRTGATTDAKLNKVDGQTIKKDLGGVVQKETLLFTDGEKAYAAFAAA